MFDYLFVLDIIPHLSIYSDQTWHEVEDFPSDVLDARDSA
jgi:hypothetical protein